MIKKIFQMAVSIFLIVFVFALLVSYHPSGQSISLPLKKIRDSQTNIPSPFIKEVLLDSIAKQEVRKAELVNANDSMLDARSKKRVKVMKAIRDLVENKKVIIIRDTVKVPIPVYIDTLPEIYYDNLIFNLN